MGTPDGMGYCLFAISLPGLIGLFLFALGLLRRKPIAYDILECHLI